MRSRSLHMDLFGPTQIKSLSGNRFVFVFFDYFSRFTWVFFWNTTMKSFRIFMFFEKELKKDFLILRIRSDRGVEFVNHSFINYCEENRIKHELSCLRTPQQN